MNRPPFYEIVQAVVISPYIVGAILLAPKERRRCFRVGGISVFEDLEFTGGVHDGGEGAQGGGLAP